VKKIVNRMVGHPIHICKWKCELDDLSSGLHFGFFSKCKSDAGHSVHMKFIFSDADSHLTTTQSSNKLS